MRKICCMKCNKYRKIKNANGTLVLSIICDKCGSKDEKIFKEEESNKVSKINGLINMEK